MSTKTVQQAEDVATDSADGSTSAAPSDAAASADDIETATATGNSEPETAEVSETAQVSETAEVADTKAAPASAKPKFSPSPRLRGLARRLAPVLAVALIVGFAGAAGYLGWQDHKRDAVDAASAAALAAANSYAVTLTSVDTANLDANFQAVLNGSTGEFRDAYTQSSTQLRQLLIDHKASGSGVVLQSAVQSATTDEVVVLLFVDQTVTNSELPDPRIDRSRIVMTMREVDGQWKASKVDIP
ncbi:DUF3329 domain-containing protein [Nocardia uniformis]|uniref:DUF3329 domain-containing protein n=1 Tax=Nocardia uniformis TaxID=53432 RepID=A0A849BU59_9NOCA|nr:DUF3329 domain-containing protein [Nocardia uniformis]NNH68538.1 DUF3329 domain-containing protein [Nocardia uniformis]